MKHLVNKYFVEDKKALFFMTKSKRWHDAMYLNKYLNDANHLNPANNSVHLQPDDDVDLLLDKAKDLSFVTIDFSDVEDGRAYSQAKLLRHKLGFKGEIRALNAHLDQLQFMSRCGVDSFKLADEYDTTQVRKHLSSMSICYQHADNNFGLIEKFKFI